MIRIWWLLVQENSLTNSVGNIRAVISLLECCQNFRSEAQWRLDLADTILAENLSLKDTLQKIWATIFDF